MGRLIDAEQYDEILEQRSVLLRDVMGSLGGAVSGCRKLLAIQPTVDAVEVVRCKDCACFEEKYRTVGEETGKVYCGGYCYHWDYEQGMSPNQVDGDDFCSHGERRSDHGK